MVIKKALAYIFVLSAMLFAREAHVSQIVYVPSEPIPLEDSVRSSTEVLVVKQLGKTRELQRKVFPKETHFQKSSETVYVEYAELFEVVQTLKSSRTFQPGEIISVFVNAAYGEHAIREAHEKGIVESPALLSYAPHFKCDTGTCVIFLTQHPTLKEVWLNVFDAREGLGAMDLLVEILRAEGNVIER